MLNLLYRGDLISVTTPTTSLACGTTDELLDGPRSRVGCLNMPAFMDVVYAHRGSRRCGFLLLLFSNLQSLEIKLSSYHQLG